MIRIIELLKFYSVEGLKEIKKNKIDSLSFPYIYNHLLSLKIPISRLKKDTDGEISSVNLNKK